MGTAAKPQPEPVPVSFSGRCVRAVFKDSVMYGSKSIAPPKAGRRQWRGSRGDLGGGGRRSLSVGFFLVSFSGK